MFRSDEDEVDKRRSDEGEMRRLSSPSSLRRSVASSLIFPMLLFYSILVIFPLFWLLYTSLKSDHDIFLHPFKLPDIRHLEWNNFFAAWTRGKFDHYFLNSVILTTTTV